MRSSKSFSGASKPSPIEIEEDTIPQANPTRVPLPALTLLAALAAGPASAAPLVLDFTGAVTMAFGIFAGQGSQVVGTIHIDDACVVDSGSSSANSDSFRASWNPGLDTFMRIQVGTVMRSTEGNANPPFTLRNLQQRDGPTADIWFLDIVPDSSVSPADSDGRIELRSDGASSALLPGSGGLNGTVLVPVVENFASATGVFGERVVPSFSVSSSVFFDIDTLTAVPEPSATASTLAVLGTPVLCRRSTRPVPTNSMHGERGSSDERS